MLHCLAPGKESQVNLGFGWECATFPEQNCETISGFCRVVGLSAVKVFPILQKP